MNNEEIKASIEEKLELLSDLTPEELLLARGFILGLRANLPAA